MRSRFINILCIFQRLRSNQRGSFLMIVMVFGAIVTLMMVGGVAGYALVEHNASNRIEQRDLAFHIAEAGINYYRWHLAHNPTDYTDGTGQPGPYQHAFTDKDGNTIGYYSLAITPPLTGSTIVMVSSTGWTAALPDTKRTVQVRLGFPALTNYTFLNNSNMSFSATTIVHGEVRTNGGVRFDGTTDSWVRSAKDQYAYGSETKPGVWGAGGPTSFWEFPVTATDFFGVTADLANIRDAADAGGVHLVASGAEGWHIVFTSSTFRLYQVTTRSCFNDYCYDIGGEVFVNEQDIPANGYIFAEDDVWVEGLVGGRVTVGVGKFPVQEPYKNIYIPNNLTYTAKGSTNVIGLLAQGNIIVPYNAPDTMEIDAALLSQFGKLSHPYYGVLKDSLTIFGSQIAYNTGGWKYSSGGVPVSGFYYTNHLFDGNLRYFPPPGFPVGATYDLISWEEVK